MHKKFIRATLLLAIMLLLQSLRLIIPLPPLISIFIVGSIINACLLLALEFGNLKFAIILSIIAPIVAFLQQAIPYPLFVAPIIIANIAYVLVYNFLIFYNYPMLGIFLAALTRMLALYTTSAFAFSFIEMPEAQTTILKTLMSWPQFITGLVGGVITLFLLKRLFFVRY